MHKRKVRVSISRFFKKERVRENGILFSLCHDYIQKNDKFTDPPVPRCPAYSTPLTPDICIYCFFSRILQSYPDSNRHSPKAHLIKNCTMKYLEFIFRTAPCTEIANDVLAATLADAGFESFVTQPEGLAAYIQKALYDEEALKAALAGFPLPDTRITYTWQEAEDKDWNEEWEKNFFQPIVIDNRCVIHSTFHHDIPQVEYDIIINPQMAFGTGHHETTSLIIGELLDSDLQGKQVLDMGCGTSILAILARMRGAAACTAIDIDEWCVRNSQENIMLNHADHITVFQGDASTLADKGPFDVVIANINRNILLNDMKHYVARMNPGGELYMSGFYVDDIPAIQAEAERNGLHLSYHREKNRWAAVKFRK